jgi:hypothetical protein
MTFTAFDRIGAIGGGIELFKDLMGNKCNNNGYYNNNGYNNGCNDGYYNNGCNNGYYNNGCCDDGNRHVTKSEMNLINQNAEKDAIIATLTAEKYTDCKVEKLNEKYEMKFEKLIEKTCHIDKELTMEIERRACGDQNIVTYVNGNFIKAKKYIDSKDVKYGACQPELHCDDDHGHHGHNGHRK